MNHHIVKENEEEEEKEAVEAILIVRELHDPIFIFVIMIQLRGISIICFQILKLPMEQQWIN